VEYNKDMGTLGGQEMLVILVLALLLFGPKELPKIARTIAKAMTEFKRAQNELKTTFSREMENLERDTGVKELVATNYQADSYNYNDYGDYGDPYYDSSTHSDTTTYEASASATEGVEHMAGPLQIEAAADSVPNGYVYDAGHAEAVHAESVEPSPSIHNEGSHAVTENPVHG
jgi:sec-independent protein translocase protein TatA